MARRSPGGRRHGLRTGAAQDWPGDTVTFVPADKSHNAESINKMAPAGGELFNGPINKEVVSTFTGPGVYGIKYMPHVGMSMVALTPESEIASATGRT
jgi:pseudoazurin